MTEATSPKIFDIVPLTAGMTEDDLPEPKGGPYYVITKNKTFIHKFFHFGRVMVEVNNTGLPHLQALTKPEWKGFLWHDIPQLPAGLVGQAWSFFQQIYKDLGTEAMVYITWHREKGYRFFIPPQWNTGGHVNSKFTPEHITDGWQNVGTIHSHCNFSAFHSGTDHNDAKQQDGLHITIGHVNSDKPSYAVMVSVGGVNWDFKIEDVTGETPELVQHPRWWERYVQKAEVKTTGYQSPPNYSGWVQGSIWNNQTHKWDPPPEKPKDGSFRPSVVPAIPAVASAPATKIDTTSTLPQYQALVARYKSVAKGWDEKARMFKIGNDSYTGQNAPHLARLMHKNNVLPPGWEEDEYKGIIQATFDEFTELVEFFGDLGMKVGYYFEFDPQAAATADSYDEAMEKEVAKYETMPWGPARGSEDYTEEDDEDLRLIKAKNKPLHTMTDAELEELWN